MPCQLKEAIKELSKYPQASRAINKIIQDGATLEEEFGEFVTNTYNTPPSNTSLKMFGKGLGRAIFSIVNPSISKDKAFALSQIRIGINKFAAGETLIPGGAITIASYVNKVEIKAELSKDMYSQLTTMLPVAKALKVLNATDTTDLLDVEVERVFDIIRKTKGSHFLLHELIHSGSSEYMIINPNEPATRRISMIYKYMLENKDKFDIADTYWQGDVHEFLAEALSNPEVMLALMSVKPTNPVDRLYDMAQILLNTVLQMLGFKGKELGTLFDILLDSNLKILDEVNKSEKVSEKAVEPQTPTTDTTVAREVVKASTKAEEVVVEDATTEYKPTEQTPPSDTLTEATTNEVVEEVEGVEEEVVEAPVEAEYEVPTKNNPYAPPLAEDMKLIAPREMAVSTYVQEYLNFSPDVATFSELLVQLGKSIGTTKETNNIQLQVVAKTKAIQLKVHEVVKASDLTKTQRDNLDRVITKLLGRRAYIIDEIAAMDENVNGVSKFLDGTKAVIDTIRALKVDRKNVRADNAEFSKGWDAVIATVDKSYKAVRDIIKEYNSSDTRKGYNEDAIAIEFDSSEKHNYTVAARKVKENVEALEVAAGFISRYRKLVGAALVTLTKALVKAKALFNKAVKAKMAFTDEQATRQANVVAINDAIDVAEKAAAELYGPDWRGKRSEVLGKLAEKGLTTRKLKKAQDAKRGTSQTKKVLAVVHSTTSPLYSPNKAYFKSEDKGNLGKPGYKTTRRTGFTLGTQLSVGNPSSDLGAVEYTVKDTEFMFNPGELQFLAANLTANGVEKSDSKGNPLMGKVSDADKASHPYLMVLTNSDGTLNVNVAMAMKAAMNSYIAENFYPLTRLSAKDLQAMYGRTEENWMELSEAAIEGGVPATFIVDTVGKDIMKKLGIKPLITKDVEGNVVEDSTEFYEKITLALGYAAVVHAQNTNMIREVEVPYVSPFKGMVNDPDFVDTTVETSKEITYTYKVTGMFESLEAKTALRDHVKDIDIRLNAEPRSKTKVHLEGRTQSPEDIKKRNESTTSVPETQTNAIIKSEQISWQPTTEVIDKILAITPESLRKILGTADETADTLTKEQSISIIGKNRQIEMDIENVVAMQEAYRSGEMTDGVFFRWFMSKSGRQMIDAEGGFNPQSIKLHRYLVTTEGQRGTVDVTKDPMSMVMFKLGVAQATGFKIDKRTTKESVEFADKVLTTEGLAILEKAIAAGETSATIGDITIKIKELAHTVTALVEGAKYIEANGSPFDTVMTVEIDGLTNGFAHKLLQFLTTDKLGEGITPKTLEWLNRVGFTFSSQEEANDMVTNIQNGADGGIVDAYLTLGEGVFPVGATMESKLLTRIAIEDAKYKNELPGYILQARVYRWGSTDLEVMKTKAKALTDLMPAMRDEDGDLVDFARDLMKPAFMTFGYAAGFKSMSNGLSAELIDDIMSKLMNEDTLEAHALIAALGIEMSDAAITKFRTDLKSKPYKAITVNNGGGKTNLLESFRGLVRGVYGDTIQEEMTKEFEGLKAMNTAIIEATGSMFDIFKAVYDRKLATRGIGGAPSNEVHLEILAELEAEGITPVVVGPGSVGYEDGIALYDTKSAMAAENIYGDAHIYRKGKEGRYVRGKRRELIGPSAKGVVLYTQFTDGLGTAMTTLKHNALQIFDAYVLGVNQSDVVTSANQDFIATNMDTEWSQISSARNGLERVLTAAMAQYPGILDDVQEVQVVNEMERFNKSREDVEKDYASPQVTLQSITELNEVNQKDRAEFATYMFNAEQFVIDKKHGAKYRGKELLLTGGANVAAEPVTTPKSDDTVKPITAKTPNDLLGKDVTSFDDIDMSGFDIDSLYNDDSDIITDTNQRGAMDDTIVKSDICK